MRDRPRLSNPADDDAESPTAKATDSARTQRHGAEKRHTTGSRDNGKDTSDQSNSPPNRPGVEPDRRRSAPLVNDSADDARSPTQRRMEAMSRLEQAKRDARQMAAELRAARAPREPGTTAEPPRRPREPQPNPGRRRDNKPPGLDALLEYRDQRLRQERAKRDNGLQDLLDYRDQRLRQEQQRARRLAYDDLRRPSPPEPDEPVPGHRQPTAPSPSKPRQSSEGTPLAADESEPKAVRTPQSPDDSSSDHTTEAVGDTDQETTASRAGTPDESGPASEAGAHKQATARDTSAGEAADPDARAPVDSTKQAGRDAQPEDTSASNEGTATSPDPRHEPHQPREAGETTAIAQPTDNEPRAITLSSTNPDHRPTLDNPPPDSVIEVDDRFRYETDDQGRVVKASATLDVVDLGYSRDRSAQRRLVDKLPGDHAGHLFARIFQGPEPMINLTPMEGRTVNLSAYRKAENAWKKALLEGRDVQVEISLAYRTDTRRPDILVLRSWIDGELTQRTIRNTPRGRRGTSDGSS